MTKMRVTFKTYDLQQKRGEGTAARWVDVGSFRTLEECDDAVATLKETGPTKRKPRFTRG